MCETKWSELRRELCSPQELKMLDALIELQRSYDQAALAVEEMREAAFQRLQEAEAADERALDAENRAAQAEAELAAYKAIGVRRLYDGVVELQAQLQAQHHDAEVGCLDYRVIKALAATYELQDYLAGQSAIEEALLPEGMEE